MKVMVTGCAGFIGANLTEYLLDKGYEVVGVDNFNDYYDPKIKEFNISEFKDNPRFRLYRTDITNRDELEKVFQKNKIDAIVHFAAQSGVTLSLKIPALYVKDNVDGTHNLAEFASKHGVKNFIFASTCSIYGSSKPPCDETMDSDHPLSIYPASKKAGEVILYTYHENYDLQVTIFRFFNPLGPRLRPDMAVPKLVRAAEYGYPFTLYQGTGSERDYTYIGNMLDAIEAVLKNPQKYEIINLGNDKPISLQNLIDSVEKATKKKIKLVKGYRLGQMSVIFSDSSKAKKLVGFNPSVTLDQMIEKYYEWFKKQPEWYKKGEESWMA